MGPGYDVLRGDKVLRRVHILRRDVLLRHYLRGELVAIAIQVVKAIIGRLSMPGVHLLELVDEGLRPVAHPALLLQRLQADRCV